MSYYKTMMTGKSKKKKVIKEQSKPKKTVLDGIKQELNEWTHKPPSEKRWSKKSFDDGLTEFEQKGGKDNVNEGPAMDYAKSHKKIKHTYAQFWDAVQDFEDLLKKKGLKRHAKDVDRQWRAGAEKFYKFYFKMMDKLL